MKKVLFQTLLVLVVACLCAGSYLLGKRFLELPFRPTNDTLHAREFRFTLDFLIPGGVYLDEKITIREVIKIRILQRRSFTEEMLRPALDLIPSEYRYAASGLLFLFWSFCYMAFLRVFTIVGYGRALRASLLLAGVTYYFMPDFVPGKTEDAGLIGLALFIMALRKYLQLRKRRSNRLSGRANAPAAP